MSLFDGIGRTLELGRIATDVLRTERQRGESLVDCLSRVVAEAKQWRALGASKPEPQPQNQDGPAVWPIVIAHLQGQSDPIFALIAKDAQERHEFGVKKYGVALVVKNGRDHLRDAYQEALDLLVYLRAAFDDQALATHNDYELMRSGCVGGLPNLGQSKIHQMYVDAIDFAAQLRRALEK